MIDLILYEISPDKNFEYDSIFYNNAEIWDIRYHLHMSISICQRIYYGVKLY